MAGSSISAAEKFNQNYRLHLKVSRSIGFTVLDPNYAFGRRTMFSLLVSFSALLMANFAIWRARADVVKVMEVISYLMIIIQGFQEAVLWVLRPARYRVLFEKSRELFRQLNENEENGKVLYVVLQYTLILQRMMLYWYTIMCVLVISITFAVSVFGKKLLIMPLLLPGIDENANTGFCLLWVIHLVQLAVGHQGYVSFDGYFLYMIFPIIGYVNAIENEINKLNSMLNDSTRDEEALSAQFLRVCTLHQMLDEYEIKLQDNFIATNLVRIGSAIAGLVSCVSLIFVSDSLQTYLTLGVFFSQVTQYCLMGTIITVKNEHLMKALYTIEWYLLPKREAANLVLILQRAQNAPCSTIGGIAPLNVETYVKIMKTIYSYVMAMITFME
ncbi:odorant receptor 67d-like [Toxorhynchites rutilus septentrionalis]|uniref:odorant receptor 67d-like n=1 Tax=Toxorhynchites rutilus septentrionalis TaxID=329112 RepID=UPI00247AE46D|nr:odorant receptor 67d-like [Toxorhynchites rutilus septentrionalis]